MKLLGIVPHRISLSIEDASKFYTLAMGEVPVFDAEVYCFEGDIRVASICQDYIPHIFLATPQTRYHIPHSDETTQLKEHLQCYDYSAVTKSKLEHMEDLLRRISSYDTVAMLLLMQHSETIKVSDDFKALLIKSILTSDCIFIRELVSKLQ